MYYSSIEMDNILDAANSFFVQLINSKPGTSELIAKLRGRKTMSQVGISIAIIIIIFRGE